MQTIAHPDFEILQAYVRQADAAQFAELRLHLAGCAECRVQVDAMMALQQHYPSLESPAVAEHQQQQLVDYIEQHLPQEQRQQVQQMLQDNPTTMKAALHYASHRAAMQQAISPAPQTDAAIQTDVSFFSSLGAYVAGWFELRAPIWLSVPATAAVVLVAVMMLQIGMQGNTTQLEIVAFQDNPVLQFRDNASLPGIGFFNRADNASAVYDKVAVSMPKAGEVAIQWPAIADATEYKMRLQAFYQGEKHSLGEVITRHNSARFAIDNVPANSRYEWVLSGQTARQKTFYTSGGFVISKK